MTAEENKSMLKKLTRFLFYVSVVFLIIAGLAWINNISVTSKWDPDTNYEVEYAGSMTVLDWTGIRFSKIFDSVSVDYSTIATLIPLMGFFLIVLGFKKLLNIKEGEIIPDYFPFFKTYTAVVVALGLIGTVWGLIMIGYGNLENFDMESLTNALHTALFSTLIALIWVFIVVTPVTRLMTFLWYGVSGQEKMEPTPENIKKKMMDFTYSLNYAAQGLKNFKENINVESIRRLEESLSKSVTQREELLVKLKDLNDAQGKLTEKLDARLDEEEKSRNVLVESMEMQKKVLEKMDHKMNSEAVNRLGVRNALAIFLKTVSKKKDIDG